MIFRRDAGSVVLDVENRFAVSRVVGQAHRDDAGRVAFGAVEQVTQDAGEQGGRSRSWPTRISPIPPPRGPLDGTGRTTADSSRIRFLLERWVLAPSTTWQALRLAADFGERMDARTAWVMARLARHPEEGGFAVAHLDDDHGAATFVVNGPRMPYW